MNLKKIKLFPAVSAVVLIIIIIIALYIPIRYYLQNFGTHELSKTPSDWGAFGDYIGGVLNTIIGFFSFIVLAYLTYIVSKQSIEHSKKLSLLQRKLDAYDGLVKEIKTINNISDRMERVKINRLIDNRFSDGLLDTDIVSGLIESVKEYASISSTYAEFYQTLNNFRLRYCLIFTYNFFCEDYGKLLSSNLKLKDLYVGITKNALNKDEPDVVTQALLEGNEFVGTLTKVVNALKSEIENDMS